MKIIKRNEKTDFHKLMSDLVITTVSKKCLVLALACVNFCNCWLFAQTTDNKPKLPSGIHNTGDFENGLKYFRKFGYLPTDENPNGKYIDSILNQWANWAAKNGNREQQLITKAYIFFRFTKNDFEVISKGLELKSYEEIIQSHEYVELLQLMYNAYLRTEQYNEVLALIPALYDAKKRFYVPLPEELDHKHYDLACIYFQIKNFPEAIRHFNEYLNSQFPKSFFIKASIYHDIGQSYFNENSHDSAQFYYDLAIRYIDSYREDKYPRYDAPYRRYFRDVVLASKAMILVKEGDYNKALPFFKKELAGSKVQNEKLITLRSYYNIAEVEYFKQNAVQSLLYLDSLFHLLTLFNNNSFYSKALQLKAKCFFLKGDIKTANVFFDKNRLFVDSLEQKKVQYAYETAIVKLKNRFKEDELKLAQQNINAEKLTVFYQKIGLSLLVLFLLMLFWFGFIQYRNKKRITRQNIVITENLREKEILLKEIHHRVKNNLQVVTGFLQLQSVKHKSPQITQMVKESRLYIESMSLVHQMLYQQQDIGMVEMETYLKKMGNLVLMNQGDQIILTVKAPAVSLSTNKAIPLGLMYCELLLNSTKHAFDGGKGTITVTLGLTNKKIFEFCYADNGKGLSSNINSAKTLGFKLINMLAEEMDAQINVYSDNGMCVRLHFADSQ